MIDDHRTLPGYPRKSLVLKVRKALNRYGIRPYAPSANLNQIWRDAWTWAQACRTNDYGRGKTLKSFWKPRPKKWPTEREIASQYVFLLLTTMKNDFALRLPYEVTDRHIMPAEIAKAYEITTHPTMPLLPAD